MIYIDLYWFILIYMIYISGPLVGIIHECYFMVVDLDLLTCDIGDASATCSWASSPLGMMLALTEHRFHPFSLSFSATWLSPSSHRVTAKSYTDLRRMELERGKKCADARAEPRQKNTTNITSSENTEVDFTWFPDCGQTLPWGGAKPVSIRHFFFVKPSFLLYDGNWHCLTWSMAPLFAPFSQPLVRLKHFLAFLLVPCECCGTQSHPE